MRTFSIPYNNDLLLLDKLGEKFPEHISQCKEIYFAIPNHIAGTGRAIDQGNDYEDEIVQLLKKARDKNIEGNLLINTGCLGLRIADAEFVRNIINYIYNLKESDGLEVVTVVDYYLALEIKQAIPDIKLECSSIAYVNSLEKAKYWGELGCDIMVIPPVLNKDLKFIRQMREALPQVQLKLVLNQTCLHDCPMWQGHHNLRGHGNEGEVYLNICQNLFKEKPWLLYSSSFIPPKYMDYYDEFIDIYKLVDRRHSSIEILQNFGAYCGDRNSSEKFEELNKIIPEKVFEKVIGCSKMCSSCGFCEFAYKNAK